MFFSDTVILLLGEQKHEKKIDALPYSEERCNVLNAHLLRIGLQNQVVTGVAGCSWVEGVYAYEHPTTPGFTAVSDPQSADDLLVRAEAIEDLSSFPDDYLRLEGKADNEKYRVLLDERLQEIWVALWNGE